MLQLDKHEFAEPRFICLNEFEKSDYVEGSARVLTECPQGAFGPHSSGSCAFQSLSISGCHIVYHTYVFQMISDSREGPKGMAQCNGPEGSTKVEGPRE